MQSVSNIFYGWGQTKRFFSIHPFNQTYLSNIPVEDIKV